MIFKRWCISFDVSIIDLARQRALARSSTRAGSVQRSVLMTESTHEEQVRNVPVPFPFVHSFFLCPFIFPLSVCLPFVYLPSLCGTSFIRDFHCFLVIHFLFTMSLFLIHYFYISFISLYFHIKIFSHVAIIFARHKWL